MRCGASGSSAATSTRPARSSTAWPDSPGTWSPIDRARFAETIGGVAYWQADIPAAKHWYDIALEVRREGAAGGDPESRRELANALYNRGYAGVAEIMQTLVTPTPPDPAARALLEEALAIYQDLGDTSGEGNVLWGLGGYLMFAGEGDEAEPYFRHSMELHRAAGHRTMEAWSLHMLSTALLLQERIAEAAEQSRHALRHFDSGGDISGITLSLDVLSMVALATDDRIRGGRLWGAARQLQRVSGTGLAEWDAKVFGLMPYGVRNVFEPDELALIAAEGAALSLSDAVAYGLGDVDPFGDS